MISRGRDNPNKCMKKILITIGLLLIVGIGWLVFSPGSDNGKDVNLDADVSLAEEETIKPWEISVGLYDPAEEPSKLTQLLQSRLRELGFKEIIITELVDPSAADQEKTTLLFRPNSEEQLEVVADKLISANVYRKGLNEAIEQDVIISAWNLDDINWGEFADLANKYNTPEPAEVSVLVINAGTESGAAGDLVEFLIDQGYSQAEAINSETAEEATKPVLIQHQRNYKNAAKTLRQLLADNDYSGVAYQIQLEQDANIVIVLGPPAEPEPEFIPKIPN